MLSEVSGYAHVDAHLIVRPGHDASGKRTCAATLSGL